MPGGESGRGTGGGGKRKGETVFFAPHSGTGPTMPADHQRIGFNLFQSIQPLPPTLPKPPPPPPPPTTTCLIFRGRLQLRLPPFYFPSHS